MIINEYSVTKDLYMSWFREGQKKGVQLKITVMWTVIFVVLLTALVILMLTPGIKIPSPLIGLEAVMLLYIVYQLFLKRRISASRLYDKMTSQFGENWIRTVEFDDKHFLTRQGGMEFTFDYNEIASVSDIDNEIIIEMKNKFLIRLYKDKFVKGGYDSFSKLMESKAVAK